MAPFQRSNDRYEDATPTRHRPLGNPPQRPARHGQQTLAKEDNSATLQPQPHTGWTEIGWGWWLALVVGVGLLLCLDSLQRPQFPIQVSKAVVDVAVRLLPRSGIFPPPPLSNLPRYPSIHNPFPETRLEHEHLWGLCDHDGASSTWSSIHCMDQHPSTPSEAFNLTLPPISSSDLNGNGNSKIDEMFDRHQHMRLGAISMFQTQIRNTHSALRQLPLPKEAIQTLKSSLASQHHHHHHHHHHHLRTALSALKNFETYEEKWVQLTRHLHDGLDGVEKQSRIYVAMEQARGEVEWTRAKLWHGTEKAKLEMLKVYREFPRNGGLMGIQWAAINEDEKREDVDDGEVAEQLAAIRAGLEE